MHAIAPSWSLHSNMQGRCRKCAGRAPLPCAWAGCQAFGDRLVPFQRHHGGPEAPGHAAQAGRWSSLEAACPSLLQRADAGERVGQLTIDIAALPAARLATCGNRAGRPPGCRGGLSCKLGNVFHRWISPQTRAWLPGPSTAAGGAAAARPAFKRRHLLPPPASVPTRRPCSHAWGVWSSSRCSPVHCPAAARPAPAPVRWRRAAAVGPVPARFRLPPACPLPANHLPAPPARPSACRRAMDQGAAAPAAGGRRGGAAAGAVP